MVVKESQSELIATNKVQKGPLGFRGMSRSFGKLPKEETWTEYSQDILKLPIYGRILLRLSNAHELTQVPPTFWKESKGGARSTCSRQAQLAGVLSICHAKGGTQGKGLTGRTEHLPNWESWAK